MNNIFPQHSITFPSSVFDENIDVNITCDKSITVVGANGAGKSRLGTWMEKNGPQKNRIHRITAQRSLFFPKNTGPISLAAARHELNWGEERPHNWNDQVWENNKESRRMQARYGNDLSHWENRPLNDFDKILKFLLSENYEKLLQHDEKQRQTSDLLPMPESIIRKVKDLWERLLPHRSLDLTGGDIQVNIVGQSSGKYPAAALSDGERVIFYLISQCLSAEPESIIIIDEPELHLHKAIQSALWDALEDSRKDCAFIYLTHDLGFATDRRGSVKVFLNGYSAAGFSWNRIPSQENISEDVYLEILGSRKPVIFVEGTQGSLDLAIYQVVYPNFTIKPMGGCSAVAQATKGFREGKTFHHVECIGIVDRDYLEDGQIESLERSRIYALKVAEAENILLLPEIITLAAEQLMLDPNLVLADVKKWIIEEFSRFKEQYALEFTQHKVGLMLGRFGPNLTSAAEYNNAFKSHVDAIDPANIYLEALSAAELLIDNDDYIGILRVFNKKSLVDTVDRFFDIKKPSSYKDRVLLMCRKKIADIPNVIRRNLPTWNAEQ